MSAERRKSSIAIKTTQMLLFAGVILSISLLNVYTLQNTHRYMNVYERSLTGYFDIQRLRVVLETNRLHLDRYLRERHNDDLNAYRATVGELFTAYRQVVRSSLTGLESYFEINAIEAGLDAYLAHAESAISGSHAGQENYFLSLHRAHRIQTFIQIYIENLMRIRLNEDVATYGALQAHAQAMRTVSLLGISGIGVLFFVFVLVFSRRVSAPLRKLAHASQLMAEGRLDVHEIEVSSLDELGALARAFNRMSRNIRGLVEDLKDKASLERKLHDEELKNVRMEKALQEAQYLGLQTQINPHFLFNALNTIGRVSMFERSEKTTRLIQALSDLFRYHIRNPAKVVPLQDELNIVREYIHIQEYRFGRRLAFELICDIDTDCVAVPSFIIQPLVENSIKHGIEPREDGGTVTVAVGRNGRTVFIEVKDSGLGMTAERLAQVRQSLQCRESARDGHGRNTGSSDDGGIGIGIANVHNRLQLLYHDAATFTIDSQSGEGTVVRITIPASRDVEAAQGGQKDVHSADC